MTRAKIPCLLILAPVLALACGGDIAPLEPPESTPEHELPSSFDLSGAQPEVPDYLIELPDHDQRIFFFVDDHDGSVGVLVQGGASGSILEHSLLGDASPAVIYHAVSHDAVPPELMTLHAQLHADGEVEEFSVETQGKLPGWLLDVSFDSTSPCWNPTFRANHCAHPLYDSQICIVNDVHNGVFLARRTRRFKAGFCLQQGLSRVELFRYTVGWWSCDYDLQSAQIWPLEQFPWYVSATHYLSYVWWAPSSGDPRDFVYRGGGDDDRNAVADIGMRWSRWDDSCQQ